MEAWLSGVVWLAAGRLGKLGAWEEIRTPDLRITSALLYRLSYPGRYDGEPAAGTPYRRRRR
jgi:hypothetical protein